MDLTVRGEGERGRGGEEEKVRRRGEREISGSERVDGVTQNN